MRHEINSNNTKRALASSLKEIIKQLGDINDKITISQIVNLCGVNRNTFYYHFEDLHGLLLWTLHDDIFLYIYNMENVNGKKIREFAINYLSTNQKFLNYAYLNLGYIKFHECFTSGLFPIVMEHIHQIEISRNLSTSLVFQKFIGNFFAEQVGSIYIMQFHHPDMYHKESAMKCLELIFDFSIPDLLSHKDEIFISYEDK